MSTKSALAFQPAPRPQPRTTPEDTERLRVATEDLGFGRATTSPTASPETPSPTASPELETGARSAVAQIMPASTPTPEVRRAPALKFDVPDALWDELRMGALKRRVTVKYLVLEALAAKGYSVDLAAIPEDGRRIR